MTKPVFNRQSAYALGARVLHEKHGEGTVERVSYTALIYAEPDAPGALCERSHLAYLVAFAETTTWVEERTLQNAQSAEPSDGRRISS